MYFLQTLKRVNFGLVKQNKFSRFLMHETRIYIAAPPNKDDMEYQPGIFWIGQVSRSNGTCDG